MNNLHAFMRETQRVSNPVPVILPRRALEDHYLEDILVKKGTFISVDLLGRNFCDQNYENPNEFKPERWLEKSIGKDPFAFIPFSSGVSNCIGQNFAMHESKIIICEFLRRYDFELIKGYELKYRIAFMYEPQEPIKLNLKKRL